MKKNITFICSGSDFHSIDWLRNVQKVNNNPNFNFNIATDYYNKQSKDNLLRDDDNIFLLYNISKLTKPITASSKFDDFFRNFIKLLFVPIQVFKLKKLSKKISNNIFHAHSMYNIFLCWLSGVRFIATPMGSDILVRPNKSRVYKFFTSKSLEKAMIITVDSKKKYDKVYELCAKKSEIIQNGIDTKAISLLKVNNYNRKYFTSIRALYPNYRVFSLLKERNFSNFKTMGIHLVYPFYDKDYRNKVLNIKNNNDVDQGLFSKRDLYKHLLSTKIVFSIPESDSSPRSIYEAIFCGCIIITNFSPWIDDVSKCMRDRIIIANLKNPEWFNIAVNEAMEKVGIDYLPTKEAINKFDQFKSMEFVSNNIYKL